MPRSWPSTARPPPNGPAACPGAPRRFYDRLVSSFKDLATGSTYAAPDARYLGSVLSHYVEDAFQPFHATRDYDGQSTHQRGIHARFETDVVLRNLGQLQLAPVAIHPVGNIRNYTFDTLIDSQALVADVLRADREAASGRDVYDDAYFAAFFTRVRPLLEDRMSEASSGVASVIASAWQAAGSPALPLPGPKPPEPIRH